QAVRRLPASSPQRRVRGHRHRPRECPPHRPTPRRACMGGGRGGPWRDLLLLASRVRRHAPVIAELKRIVGAEDNANDAELTLTALRENRVANEIVTVRDGAEALDYLYRRNRFAGRPGGNPAVVLLDLKMPKVDGIEVLRQVKSDPSLRSVPVVVLTSSREEQDLVRTYNLGVNAYVVKPVDFHEFIEAVKLLGRFWAVVNETPPSGFPHP